MWGISSRMLQQSAVAPPYLGRGRPSDLERGVAPLSPPAPAQTLLLGHGVTPLSCHPCPRMWGRSSWLLQFSSVAQSCLTLCDPMNHSMPGHRVDPLGCHPCPRVWGSSSWPLQFSSVAQSCPTLCDPMNRSTPGHPVDHQLQEFTQTQVHRVSDAIHIQPSHPLSSPSPPPLNPSQHQGLFQ